MSSIFLSYARQEDSAFVRALHERLSIDHTVWFDLASMPNRGLSFLHEIRDAIDGCDRMVVVLGPRAAASEYVRCEWQYALVAGKAVTPILRCGSYELVPAELKNLDCPDFRDAAVASTVGDRLIEQLRAARTNWQVGPRSRSPTSLSAARR